MKTEKNLYTSPKWAKKAIWYQIFPERFNNGDPSNDPTIDTLKNAYPHDHTNPWNVHPWTADWYEMQPYEQKNDKDIWHNLNRRRYGGDIRGIIDKLDYLQDLGINALYLNPVFKSPSHHKYDGATYHHIDPNFGPDPKGDRKLIAKETPTDPETWEWTSADKLFLKLIEEVHRRNMHIIIDGVFNHVGLNFWAFQDVVQHQQESKYANWFEIHEFGEPGDLWGLDVTTWEGYNELPEWREDKNGIIEEPRNYIFNITKRWMDPNGNGDTSKGVDGWRLDVAFHVKHPFWRDWRKHVRDINAEAYIVGEVFGDLDFLGNYLQGDQFDAVMNYHFTFAVSEFFVNQKKRISANEFDQRLEELRRAFRPQTAYVMQNLLGSHDTDRISSKILNRDRFDYRSWNEYHRNTKGDNLDFIIKKPGDYEYTVLKLIVIFQFTYLGAPMIYYGDETGMWGANDPCCRKPMIWPELHYDNEVYERDGSRRDKRDPVVFNKELHNHYKNLIRIRRNHPALQIGDFKSWFIDDKREVYSFRRRHEDETIFILLNNGEDKADISPSLPTGSYKDLLNREEISLREGSSVSLPGKWGRILLKT